MEKVVSSCYRTQLDPVNMPTNVLQTAGIGAWLLDQKARLGKDAVLSFTVLCLFGTSQASQWSLTVKAEDIEPVTLGDGNNHEIIITPQIARATAGAHSEQGEKHTFVWSKDLPKKEKEGTIHHIAILICS